MKEVQVLVKRVLRKGKPAILIDGYEDKGISIDILSEALAQLIVLQSQEKGVGEMFLAGVVAKKMQGDVINIIEKGGGSPQILSSNL